MADNQDEVVYSFEGDVTSLRQATQEAISLLDKFDAAIKATASSNAFSASKTSATNFQRTVGGLIRQVNTLTSSLNGTGSAIDTAMPDGSAIVEAATRDFANVLDYLNTTSEVTSSDLKYLTEFLRSTKTAIDPVIARAQLLASSLKPLEQLRTAQTLQNTSTAAKETQKHFEAAASSGFRVQEAYVASGKSAAESAAVFLKASRSAESMKSVQSVIRRVQTDLQLLGVYAKQAWAKFSEKLDPLTSKIQSFKDKTAKAFGNIKSIMAQVSSAFRRTATEADSGDASFKSLSSRANRLSSSLKTLGRQTKSNVGNFNQLSKITRSLRNAVSALTGVQIGNWLAEAAKQSISYRENLNLFTVAMSDSLDVGNEFINQMAEIYGMDPSNLMRYAGNFYQLSDAISMPDESAAKLSLSLLKATNDISSLFNVPIDTVFQDLSSGMQGMSRAVRKYGMDIRVTTLQQTALSLGISDNVKQMSEANRQGLRFITMMRQASNASGDFARTIESPANQLKVFKEQIAQLGRAIGDLFIGPLATAVQYINGFVMALRLAISFVGSALGLVKAEAGSITSGNNDVAESIQGIGSAASEASKKIKGMLAPFDELNVLQDQTASGAGGSGLDDIGSLDPAIVAEIEKMELKLESIRMKALDVRDAFLEFFGFKVEDGSIISWDSSEFETNLIDKFPQWTQTIQATFNNWSSIVQAFGEVLNALAGVAQSVWRKVAKFFGKFINDDSVASFIDDLADNLSDFAKFLNENQDAIADFAIALGVLTVAFKTIATVGPALSSIATFASNLISALAPYASAVSWIVGIAAAIAVLYTTSANFATSFDSLLVALGEGLGTVFTALWDTLQVLGTSLQTLWDESILPMLTSIGDGMAPVVETLIDLWEDFAAIIADALNMVSELWTSILEPALSAFFEAVGNLAEVFGTLWSEIIGPVLKYIGDGIVNLWESTLRPIFENVVAIIGGIIEIILALWNNVLAPIGNWLLQVLAPLFVAAFTIVWDVVSNVIEDIGEIVNGVLEILRGLIDFIAGVFTGDWRRAWEGVVSVFSGIWDTLEGTVKLAVNAVIGVINKALGAISDAINSIIRAINTLSFTVPDWVPGLGGKTFGFNLPEVDAWAIPYLASGAVVTSPTMAMIGEGHYDEAVIPLGNSPQMKDLVNQIAEATKAKGANAPIQVQVFIGNEQVAEYMHRAEKRAQLQTNGGV